MPDAPAALTEREPGRIEFRIAPADGRYVRLSVSDSGPGMDAPTMARIFDPFFTTKPPGVGSGLGLSIVHSILKSCGGTITVEPGNGATFHVVFVAADDAAAPRQEAPSTDAPARGGRILIVDDERALVLLLSRLLKRRGHSVTGHTCSNEALRDFRSAPHGFDVIVTDLTMPEMTGFDLAREFLAVRPDIPIVLTSGLASAEDRDRARALGIRHVLAKPTAADELETVVAALLRSSDGAAGE